MARSYANILTAIWAPGSSFRLLSVEAQRCYLMVVTQPDISAAGVLPLTVRRWADHADDTTSADITRTLNALADAAERYLVIDWDTEEVLVRSFVRHDQGYRNSKRRPAILAASRDVRSLLLRRALAAEFERLQLPAGDLDDRPDPTPPPAEGPSRTASTAPVDNSVDNVKGQFEGLSGAQPGSTSPSDRVVGTKGEYVRGLTPQPTLLHPAATGVPIPAAGPEEGEADPEQDQHDLVDQVRAIRPEWPRKSILRALRHPDVLERPQALVGPAMLAVARDPASQAPGRLPHDGPWWATAARAAPTATQLPPPCGQCGPNRLVEHPDGGVGRCPRCHPRRAGAAA